MLEGRKPLILVVDDEDGNPRLLQALLAGESYRVTSASDGAQAPTRAAAEPPDLVLLDAFKRCAGRFRDIFAVHAQDAG